MCFDTLSAGDNRVSFMLLELVKPGSHPTVGSLGVAWFCMAAVGGVPHPA